MDEQKIIDYRRTLLRLKLEKFIYLDMYMDYHPCINKEVFIYGAGVVGKLLLRCFEKMPRAFIDAKKGMKEIGQIPVYCIDELPENILTDECTIIVTPVWAMDMIKDNLYKYNPNINIVSLEELVEEL